MRSRLKAVIQYVIIFGITALLMWLSLRNLTVSDSANTFSDKWDYLKQTWQTSHKGWLIAVAVVALISHLVRAERWRMLIASSGHRPKLGDSFLSLMVGYLVNLVIPRGGEISRCYNLYKLDKTPVELSFGTVVVERLVDLICLLSLVALSFLMEYNKLVGFVQTLPIASGTSKFTVLLYGIAVLALIGVIFAIFYKKNLKFKTFVLKTLKGFKEGLLSITKLQRKGLFIFYSLTIWLLYFTMSYFVLLAFPETEHLGIGAVLSLFAIGSIAMAAPLPGGTGSYHVLVPQGLVFLYQVSSANAVAFVFIFHGWQTAILIVGGALSLIITSALVRRRS